MSARSSPRLRDEECFRRPLVTGAAEFFWYVSGQVFQTLTGNAYRDWSALAVAMQR